MSLSRRSIRGALGKVVLVALGTPVALLTTDGCNQQQVAGSLRSLEHSGRVSFVCLSAPGTRPSLGRSIFDCSLTRYESQDDYEVVDGVTTQPHLYALVTQTTRGEVAVVDMSTTAQPVLDQDPRIPGANFLPVGAQPVDIVSTNDGDATFVGVAEIGRQGIFALPSTQIRPSTNSTSKSLSDWPACALPGAPGRMLIVDDPPVDGKIRTSCDGTHETISLVDRDSKGNELVNVTDAKLGRPKLVTTIPELGAIAIIDAQTLFEPERDADGKPQEDANGVVYKYPPGSWKACPIERWVPLETSVPVVDPPPAGAGGPACVDKAVTSPAAQQQYESYPSAMARSDKRLFIADAKAPVIHVLNIPTPCEPDEGLPLLPSSKDEPNRIVTTNAVAVTGTLAAELGQFVYAVDDYNGSLMAFDVGPKASSREPILRPNKQWAPFQSKDRIDFGVPIQDLTYLERDNPQPVPATGIATEGVRCDPDPSLTVCTSDSASCDPETLYRASSSYDRGAGPTRMRGSFVYAMLTTGQIAVVDIDDYDKECRIPRRPSHLNGCPAELILEPTDPNYESTDEASCNVVVPHTQRDANYMRTGDKTGQNQPGVQVFPTLYNDLGALQSTFDPKGIVMRATMPNPPPYLGDPGDDNEKKKQFSLSAGTSLWAITHNVKLNEQNEYVDADPNNGLVLNGTEFEHTLAANLEDPRAQSNTQAFSVTYEGSLPGFFGKGGKIRSDTTPATFSDSSSRFCDQGVLGQKAFVEMVRAEDPTLTQAEAERRALELADLVQISSDSPPEDDAYWQSEGVKGVCSFDQCKTAFGPIEIPKTTRDLKIIEAYQDHLDVALPDVLVPSANDPTKKVPVAGIVQCCFPTLVGFNVRVGHQWAVVGTASGFIHHVIPTPLESSTAERAVGVCRNSCDPDDVRKNGRVLSVKHGEILRDGDKRAFINPFFRFAINEAENGNPFDGNPDSPDDNAPKRNTFFQFNTQGTFRPLLVNLAATTAEIQPQSIGFVPATNEVVIVDGSLEGLILLNSGSLDKSRQYY